MNGVLTRQSSKGISIVVLSAFFVLVVLGLPSNVRAADMQFLGETITPTAGKYLVKKDVNVRAAPKTSGKRVAGLKKGEIIRVVGRVGKTAWLAVLKANKPLGFVYGTILSPIIDGEIEEDVTGEIRLGADHRCGFRVHFIGKAGGEGQEVRSADYDVSVVCERRSERIRFPAQMFMTEVPFDGSNKRQVFQVNVDVLDGVHGLIDVFSTIMLFDLDKGEVRFDSVTEKSYGRENGGLKSLPSTNVSRALSSAVEIALTHWSDTAWNDIFKQAK